MRYNAWILLYEDEWFRSAMIKCLTVSTCILLVGLKESGGVDLACVLQQMAGKIFVNLYIVYEQSGRVTIPLVP